MLASQNRHTMQRRLVLAALKLTDRPLTAEEVVRVVQHRQRVSVSTVYRNLDVLTERGEIFRFTDPRGVHRFSGVPQSLVYCTCGCCGQVESLAADRVSDDFRQRFPQRGIRVATVYLQGTCAVCAKPGHRKGAHRG
ncbi:MAG: transcriptional repressor [Candidatus Kerfeldbacteria bacterium]|nr:transcriptional repressor [Candidatus Kerfeldbacteria bacterium]